MRQLTVRGFDEQLESRLCKLARREGISLNRAALVLMRRGAGLEPATEHRDAVGDALDEFIGVWSEEEEREFLASLKPLERIDDDFWS